MGDFTTLMARDGHEFQAYLAAPPGRPRGAVVVLQEIFGVNPHIRSVTDGFAAEGYTAIAPALFDRIRRGIQLGYGDADRDEVQHRGQRPGQPDRPRRTTERDRGAGLDERVPHRDRFAAVSAPTPEEEP